jgi:predicted phosphatase
MTSRHQSFHVATTYLPNVALWYPRFRGFLVTLMATEKNIENDNLKVIKALKISHYLKYFILLLHIIFQHLGD